MKYNKSLKSFFTKHSTIAFILGALVTIILNDIFEPILKAFYSLVIYICTFFIKSFSDSIYKSISNGFSEKSSNLTLYLIILIISGIAAYFYAYLKQTINTTLKNISNKIEPVQNDNNHKNSKSDITTEVIKSQKYVKKYFLSTKICIFCFLTVILFAYSKEVYINSYIVSITNNIEIVSPYISDLEYKQLKSSFHAMQNRSDYDKINEMLLEISKKNCLTLK